MKTPRDPPLDPAAIDLLSRATLAELRDEADEFSALVRTIQK
jgi:hypothetical protein